MKLATPVEPLLLRHAVRELNTGGAHVDARCSAPRRRRAAHADPAVAAPDVEEEVVGPEIGEGDEGGDRGRGGGLGEAGGRKEGERKRKRRRKRKKKVRKKETSSRK